MKDIFIMHSVAYEYINQFQYIVLPFFRISLTTESAILVLLPSPSLLPPKSFTTTLAPLEAKSKAYVRPKPRKKLKYKEN